MDAIRVLLDNGLKFKLSRTPFLEACTIHMRLNVAEWKEGELDWYYKLMHVLMLRIKDNVLNLNNLPNDPEFAKLTILINSRSVLCFIIDNVRRLNNNITRIDLENCGLTHCEGLSNLTYYQKLKTLNLRNNKIADLNNMRKSTSIREVLLDNNPICNKTPVEYTKYVQEYFKYLDMLDDRKVLPNSGTITFQNYIVNRNAYTLVDKFVKNVSNQLIDLIKIC
jgi:hypothetical protein